MSELPQSVKEAGLLFRRGDVQEDLKIRQEIIDWGYAQIDAEYPEDPLRAPLNLVRRGRARREWERVIRTAGRDLRGVIANLDVKELEFQIERRRAAILAEDAEKRRQKAVIFDTRVQLDADLIRTKITLENQKELLTHQHTLDQEAEDNASRRRKEERIEETNQDINLLVAQAITKAMGPNPTDTLLDAAKRVGHQVAEIRANPDLTDDDQHLQIQILLESLPNLFNDLRSGHD